MEPTEAEFNALIDQNPLLCNWGWWNNADAKVMKLSLEVERAHLRGNYKQFVICVHWITANCTPIKRVHSQFPTSRTLQQIAKHAETGYVGNGAMLTALLYHRVPYKLNDGPNPSVAISRKSSCFKTSPP